MNKLTNEEIKRASVNHAYGDNYPCEEKHGEIIDRKQSFCEGVEFGSSYYIPQIESLKKSVEERDKVIAEVEEILQFIISQKPHSSDEHLKKAIKKIQSVNNKRP